jgi:hypothetical protein
VPILAAGVSGGRARRGAAGGYGARKLGLALDRFDADRSSANVLTRIQRDVDSGRSGEVRGTPTIFIDGVVHTGSYDATCVLREVTGR